MPLSVPIYASGLIGRRRLKRSDPPGNPLRKDARLLKFPATFVIHYYSLTANRGSASLLPSLGTTFRVAFGPAKKTGNKRTDPDRWSGWEGTRPNSPERGLPRRRTMSVVSVKNQTRSSLCFL